MRFVPVAIAAFGMGCVWSMEARHFGPQWLLALAGAFNGGVFGWCLRGALYGGPRR